MDVSDLEPVSHARLAVFAERVAASPHNLVSRADRTRLWERHIADCLSIVPQLPLSAHRLLDVGTGAGFPGLVIAIVRPDVEVHLLDATQKKVRFIEEVADELDVKVTLHVGRAEELSSGPLGGSFDVVTARAVAPLRRLVAWVTPYLGPSGVIVAMKGERWQEELDEAGDVIAAAGLEVLSTPDDQAYPWPASGRSVPRLVMLTRRGRADG